MSTLQTIQGFYHLPEEVINDLALYKSEVNNFITGETDDATRFKAFRVSRGV